MDIHVRIEFLKSAISRQQTTLRLQIALAATLFVIGISAVILSLVSAGLILDDTLKTGQMLGGTVVAASGFIPIFFSRPSVVTSKPANEGHLKTGHSTDVRDKGFLLLQTVRSNSHFGSV
jgi:hypothetical protein